MPFPNTGRELLATPPKSTKIEILISVQPLIFSILLRNLLLLGSRNCKINPWVHLVVENFIFTIPFSLICISTIVLPTQFHYFICGYTLSVFLMAILALIQTRCSSCKRKSQGDAQKEVTQNSSPRIPAICNYRGCLYLATVVCIFARDLKGFNSIFVKATTYGTGLMDVGVGSFLFMMGLLGPTARHLPLPNMKSASSEIRKAIQFSAILLAFGILKAIMHSLFHLSQSSVEYGRDWNVFFTLGVIKFLGTLAEVTLCRRYCQPIFLGLLISIAYEIALQKVFKQHILLMARDNLFTANREGIAQLANSLSIYLCGNQIGRYLFQVRQNTEAYKRKSAFVLGGISLVVWTSTAFLQKYNILDFESRRLGNLSYLTWMICFATFLMVETFAIEIMTEFLLKSPDEMKMFEDTLLAYIDRNGFVYFIIGNLLTGVPRIFKLETPGHWWAVVILVIYASVTAFLAVNLSSFLKFLSVKCRLLVTLSRCQICSVTFQGLKSFAFKTRTHSVPNVSV